MRLSGVLLDVDGTLIDSNDAHAEAWVQAFADSGRPVSFRNVRRCIGMGGDKLLPTVVGLKPDSPEGKEISKRRGEIFQRQHLPQLQAFPGATALLRQLKSRGFHLAVASSAKDSELQDLLRICRAHEFIESQTSADDANKSKPSPDIVHAALAKLHVPADRAVMIGDTPYDVEAALQAGVKPIGLRCGGWKDAELVGAVAIYDDPQDLLAHFDSSPLA